MSLFSGFLRKRVPKQEGKPTGTVQASAEAGKAAKPSGNPANAPAAKRGAAKNAGAPSAAGNRRQVRPVKPASDAEIAEVLKFSGRVLTAPGEQLELTEKQRQVVAILENGTIVATRTDRLDPGVQAARSLARRRQIAIRREVFVDLEIIRKVYHNAARRQGAHPSQLDTTKMQRDFLNLVREANGARASDIYIIIGDRYEAKLFFRVNGIIRPLRQIPAGYAHNLLSTAFYMSRESDASYQIHERQQTRISNLGTPLPDGLQAMRLQFNPMSDEGRYLSARLLYNQEYAEGTDVDVLGYAPKQVEQIQIMRRKPFGLNIICGPTGSGKSTTLQLTLIAQHEERDGAIMINTIEDPPEYTIRGAAQFPITNVTTDEERSAQFSQAIRAVLRSAPDVIMIGEIRDAASAQLAFEAGMTGHQLWSTIHANDAASIIDRLRDVHVEDFKLTDESLVTGLIGQRLVRRLCSHCRIPLKDALGTKDTRGLPLVDTTTIEAIKKRLGEEALQDVHICNPKGCDHERCDHGYEGRTVVAECILPDAGFMDLMRAGKKREAIKYWLDNLDGIRILEHAAAKVVAGICDPGDVTHTVGPFSSLDPDRRAKILGVVSDMQTATRAG